MHMRHEIVRTARDIEPKPNGATQMPQAQTVSYAARKPALANPTRSTHNSVKLRR